MGMPQTMIVKFWNPQLMPCDMADVLHIAAIDIGTIRADHYQMDFCTIPIAVKMSDIITEPTDVEVITDCTILFLTCFFTL